MQEDTLRDFLKFFRFNLPWFVLSAGFFAVIIFAGLFITSKINTPDTSTDSLSQEKLEIAVTGEVQETSEVIEGPSTPSAIQLPTPSSIVSPLPVPTISTTPKPPEKPTAPTPIASPTPEPTTVPISTPTTQADENKDIEASKYVVKAGDSLWTIAERAYGTGFEYKQIMTANNIDNQFELTTGQTLVIPANQAKGQIASGVFIDHGEEPSTKEESNEVSKEQDYKVIKGDSLWKIADQQLNDPYRWTEIYELNKKEIGKNPNLIYSDTVLKLPERLSAKIVDQTSNSSSSTNASSNWTVSLSQ